MVACRVWIRLALPEKEFVSVRESAPGCEFFQGDDSSIDARRLAEIDAVFTEEPLPDSLVEKLPNLKWLHVVRGGVIAYLTPAVKRRPIQLTSSKGIHGAAFSEFALTCMFALAKKLPHCWEAQQQRQWLRLNPENLEGKTLGIVGLGTVGSALARKARALGMRIIAIKRTVSAKPDEVDELGPPEFLPALLEQSDFVVLCLASIPSTMDIIREPELRLMKKSAYLINLTGGKAVEEALLVRALKEGWIAGAALDAFPRQPLPADSELWSLPNAMITPRVGGQAAQNWPLLLPIFIDNLKRYVAGEPLRNVIDKELGY
jgi:phosphoglycerate dehydrogenase-like enzyme